MKKQNHSQQALASAPLWPLMLKLALPAVVARRLRYKEIVECDNCGRILFVRTEA